MPKVISGGGVGIEPARFSEHGASAQRSDWPLPLLLPLTTGELRSMSVPSDNGLSNTIARRRSGTPVASKSMAPLVTRPFSRNLRAGTRALAARPQDGAGVGCAP
jgi:hypothetical protein